MDRTEQWRQQDRRGGSDRRQGFPSLKSLIVYRRRRQLRRASDRRGIALLDYYHPPLMISIVSVLVLSVVDAILTIFLMDHGAVELNPVMAFFIELGSLPFIIAKYTLTAFFVCTIIVFNYYFFARLKLFTRNLLHIFTLGFAAVVVWEIVLAFRYAL